LKRGGGRWKRGGYGGDEGEGSGDGDFTNAEVAKGDVNVGDGGKEVVDGFRVNVGEGVTDGDGGDFGAWVERKHVSVDPCTCDGAVSGDGSDEVVGDSEEEGDVGEEERTDYGWVGFFETEVSEFEVLHGGGDAVR